MFRLVSASVIAFSVDNFKFFCDAIQSFSLNSSLSLGYSSQNLISNAFGWIFHMGEGLHIFFHVTSMSSAMPLREDNKN